MMKEMQTGGKADFPFASLAVVFRKQKPFKDDTYYVSYQFLSLSKNEGQYFLWQSSFLINMKLSIVILSDTF